MSASLVGSEMCIRDRSSSRGWHAANWDLQKSSEQPAPRNIQAWQPQEPAWLCPLCTTRQPR
eukprot:6709903-Alexandrium_andersonii.AAC.1